MFEIITAAVCEIVLPHIGITAALSKPNNSGNVVYFNYRYGT